MIYIPKITRTGERAVLHRIVRAPTNLPIREVITGTKTVSTQRYSSYRYGGAFGIEGRTAMLLAEHDEVVTEIYDSAPEFCRFEGIVDGSLAATIPDRFRVLSNGRVQVIECKHNWNAFFKPTALKQSLLTQASCDELGWEYLRIVPQAIGTEQFRRNVHHVQLFRHVAVSPAQKDAAIACTTNGPTTLGTLCAAVEAAVGRHPGDAYVIGRVVAYALMVQRIISINLHGDLGYDARVDRVPAAPLGLPSFRSKLFI